MEGKPNSQLPKGALRRSPEIKLTKSFRKSEEGRRSLKQAKRWNNSAKVAALKTVRAHFFVFFRDMTKHRPGLRMLCLWVLSGVGGFGRRGAPPAAAAGGR